ncbi:hypothetical protein D3C85_1464670 [compost metagenome]
MVHLDIGRLRQRVEVHAILRVQRDAHGRRHGQFMVVDLVGLARGFEQLVGDARRAMRVGAGQQQHELVAADARDRILFAHHRAQPLGDLHQQGVAHAVTQRIVDMLEMVQVQEDRGQRRVVVARQLDGLGAAVGEQGAIG